MLILKRNATRDYLDLVALAEHMGAEKMIEALRVCQAHVADPSAQRYHFWKQYAERHLA